MKDAIMNKSKILLYQNQEGSIKIDVHLEQDNLWLSQKQMALLFGKNKRTISEHIRNIFKEGELEEEVVVRNFQTTTKHDAINTKMNKKNLKKNKV